MSCDIFQKIDGLSKISRCVMESLFLFWHSLVELRRCRGPDLVLAVVRVADTGSRQTRFRAWESASGGAGLE